MFAEHVLLLLPSSLLFLTQLTDLLDCSGRKLTATMEEKKKHPPHLPSSSLYTILEIYLQFISTSGLDPGQEITSTQHL